MTHRPPAFQFYPADFLSDENVVLMTNQEIGCYIKLLCYCWREGSVPNDIPKIARLCGEPEEIIAQLWLAISPCFTQLENYTARLVNPRLVEERKKQEEHRKERSASGKKGAISRWNRNEQGDSSAITELLAEPIANDSSSSSSSSSNNTPIIPEDFNVFWNAYPRKKSKGAAKKAWKKIRPRPTKELLDTMLGSIERLKRSREWQDENGRFIPYPASWLYDEGWNDEVLVLQHPGPGTSSNSRAMTPEEIRALREAND